jgi:hypothetical protein
MIVTAADGRCLILANAAPRFHTFHNSSSISKFLKAGRNNLSAAIITAIRESIKPSDNLKSGIPGGESESRVVRDVLEAAVVVDGSDREAVNANQGEGGKFLKAHTGEYVHVSGAGEYVHVSGAGEGSEKVLQAGSGESAGSGAGKGYLSKRRGIPGQAVKCFCVSSLPGNAVTPPHPTGLYSHGVFFACVPLAGGLHVQPENRDGSHLEQKSNMLSSKIQDMSLRLRPLSGLISSGLKSLLAPFQGLSLKGISKVWSSPPWPHRVACARRPRHIYPAWSTPWRWGRNMIQGCTLLVEGCHA